MTLAEDPASTVLLIHLDCVVPLLIAELRQLPAQVRDDTRMQWARQAAPVIGSRGDQIQFLTPRRHATTGTCLRCRRPVSRTTRHGPWLHTDTRERWCDQQDITVGAATPEDDGGGTADAVGHLARGLAAAAFQPGGLTFAGRHWCTDHDVCEAAQAAARGQEEPSWRR